MLVGKENSERNANTREVAWLNLFVAGNNHHGASLLCTTTTAENCCCYCCDLTSHTTCQRGVRLYCKSEPLFIFNRSGRARAALVINALQICRSEKSRSVVGVCGLRLIETKVEWDQINVF